MTALEAGVLDTSVLIAREAGRPMRAEMLPARSAITVITEAEIRVGVLAAPDADTRARRLETLHKLMEYVALPVDSRAAAEWARLRAHLAQSRRRMNVNDLWIAAIATAQGLPIITQDGDFDAISDVPGVRVIFV